MILFIRRVVLFISIPLFFILGIDTTLRNQNSLYKEKYEGAIKLKDSIEVVILGNSHANYGVDPSAFDMCAYNLANVQQSIYFDKRITLSLMPYLKKLKFVLISIDYHSLYYSSQGIRDVWSYYGNGVKYNDLNYMLPNISPFLFGYTPKVSISLIKKRISNKIKYGNEILDFDVETGIDIKGTLKNGFISFDSRDETAFSDDSFMKRANSLKVTSGISSEKQEVYNDLVDFIEILIANNITPIIFTTPTYSEFNRYLDETIINDNASEIKNLCNKYGLVYLNFMDSRDFGKKDFFNADHLNKFGAYKFAEIINDTINNIDVVVY